MEWIINMAQVEAKPVTGHQAAFIARGQNAASVIHGIDQQLAEKSAPGQEAFLIKERAAAMKECAWCARWVGDNS